MGPTGRLGAEHCALMPRGCRFPAGHHGNCLAHSFGLVRRRRRPLPSACCRIFPKSYPAGCFGLQPRGQPQGRPVGSSARWTSSSAFRPATGVDSTQGREGADEVRRAERQGNSASRRGNATRRQALLARTGAAFSGLPNTGACLHCSGGNDAQFASACYRADGRPRRHEARIR